MTAADSSENQPPGPPPPIPLRKVVALLALQAVGMGAIGALLWRLSGREQAGFVSLSALQALQGLALGLALIAVAYALFRALPRISERLVRMQADTYAFLGPRLGWPAIVAISICAGAGEEALFRGGLQTLLGDYVGVPLAIALSSAMFALIHCGKPAITALLLVIGAIFGIVFWLTGSLLAVMVGHALYDIWALRYLHREFVRLGLAGDPPPPLANPASRS